MTQYLYKGADADLCAVLPVPDQLVFKAEISGAGAMHWLPTVLMFSGYYKKIDSAQAVSSFDPLAPSLLLSSVPSAVNRIVFALYCANPQPLPVCAETCLLHDGDPDQGYFFNINQTEADSNAVVVFELVKRLDRWILKAVGLNVWGGLETIYGRDGLA